MASPPRTPTPPAAQVRQYFWRNYAKKEVCLYIHTLKPLKARKEEGDLKFKCPWSASCQNHSDVIVNKPVVARKRCAQKKHSLVSKKGFLKITLSMCSQTFTKVALMLAVVISILGGVLNVKLPGRISTFGPTSLVCHECEYGNNSNSAHPLSFVIFRESAAAIIDLSKGLCSRISKVMFLTGNKQLAGSMKMLENTLRRGVTIVYRFSRPRELARSSALSRSKRYSTRSEPTSLPWPYRLLSTPVLGRRAGRTQMEESKTLGCGSLNV